MGSDYQYVQGSNGGRQEKDIFFSHRVRYGLNLGRYRTKFKTAFVYVVDYDKLDMKQTYWDVLSFQVKRHPDIALQMEKVSLNFCKPIQL